MKSNGKSRISDSAVKISPGLLNPVWALLIIKQLGLGEWDQEVRYSEEVLTIYVCLNSAFLSLL